MNPKPITSKLYYDGKCSLCKKEITLLNKLKNSNLELIDIWSVEIEIPRNDLLQILHLQTKEGSWKKGLEANIAAWQFTPIGLLWRPLQWPIIRVISNAVYLFWAKKRLCTLPKN